MNNQSSVPNNCVASKTINENIVFKINYIAFLRFALSEL